MFMKTTPAYRTVVKWMAKFKDPKRDFKGASRSSHPATKTIDENIEAGERMIMRDRQVSDRHVADELDIPKSIVHEIMSNHFGMCNVCIRWVPKFLTPSQRTRRTECCLELLQGSEPNPTNFFGRIVTEEESWTYYYNPPTKLKSKV